MKQIEVGDLFYKPLENFSLTERLKARKNLNFLDDGGCVWNIRAQLE